jgi:DNA polymerase III subunit gamma/tau
MSEAISSAESAEKTGDQDQPYVVVARRYRPQTFAELVGQEHVAQALSNAIATQRVGHAYLFTGARGVGKTSAARILAKALNCEHGPAAVPCNQCDICQSISTGEDVDVLEIDGASNRGIDEIRQLRQNVNVRPSRSRYKIYIIDEVHMLTREAFNALLKTLEEPPEHVKFIFCTTEPTKIPITILSRCQRFDFAGIDTGSIAVRLRQIVEAEHVEADTDALEVLARRAAGSMRDSQSLLEQLLAFAPGRITLDDVHGMLGTAGDQRLAALAAHLIDRNPAAALADLELALGEGVDVSQLLEQLFGYFRDCMAAAAGCPAESFLYASPASSNEVQEAGKRMGLTTILAVMQIIEQALSRIRYSTQGRIIAELALVRICHLEELDDLPALIAQLQSGEPIVQGPMVRATGSSAAPPGEQSGKKNDKPAATSPISGGPSQFSSGGPSQFRAPSGTAAQPGSAWSDENGTVPLSSSHIELTADSAAAVWTNALSRLSGMAVEQAKSFERATACGPDHLVISFKPGYALAKAFCQRPDNLNRFEQALADVTGHPVRVEFKVHEDTAGQAASTATPERTISPHQRLLEMMKHPLIQRAGELFGAQPIRVDEPPRQTLEP